MIDWSLAFKTFLIGYSACFVALGILTVAIKISGAWLGRLKEKESEKGGS